MLINMKELTKKDLERQDFIDNSILNLIEYEKKFSIIYFYLI